MKRIELMEKLKDYVVFTALDIEKIIGNDRAYAYTYIQRLKKANLIYEIEKGRYTCFKDAFLIASRIIWPSYISGWTALQYYNLTEQLPQTIEIVTPRSRKKRKINFMGVKIEFSRVKPDHFFAYERVTYGKHEIFMAKKEKALLDALFLKHISPTEFKYILKTGEEINIRKLKEYAKKISKLLFIKVKKIMDGKVKT